MAVGAGAKADGARLPGQLHRGGAEEGSREARAGAPRARTPDQRMIAGCQGRVVQIHGGPPGPGPATAVDQLIVPLPGMRRDEDASRRPGRTPLKGEKTVLDAGGVDGEVLRLRGVGSRHCGGTGCVRLAGGLSARSRCIGQPGGGDLARHRQCRTQSHPLPIAPLLRQPKSSGEALLHVAVPRIIGIDVGLRSAPPHGASLGDEDAVIIERLDEQAPRILGGQAAHIRQAVDLQAVRRPPPRGRRDDQPHVR